MTESTGSRTKLFPCPFCGNQPLVDSESFDGVVQIGCFLSECGFEPFVCRASYEEAAALWNRRVPPSEVELSDPVSIPNRLKYLENFHYEAASCIGLIQIWARNRPNEPMSNLVANMPTFLADLHKLTDDRLIELGGGCFVRDRTRAPKVDNQAEDTVSVTVTVPTLHYPDAPPAAIVPDTE